MLWYLRYSAFYLLSSFLLISLLYFDENKMNSSAFSATSIKPILVIGGTGRVGKSVVSKLIKQGFNVRVMVREKMKAETVEELKGADLVVGDVANMETLLNATQGCSTVVDVHGMRPLRFSKLTDFFCHPKGDPLHPYNVNYLGVEKILSAMSINKVNKIVRVTGSLVGKSAFLYQRVLFNVLLSFTGKWHEASEMAIRKSGLDYTVVRPTGLMEESSISLQKNRSLVLIPGDSKELPKSRQIPIVDVADLIVLAATQSVDGQSRLSRSSVVCGTETCQTNNIVAWDSYIEKVIIQLL